MGQKRELVILPEGSYSVNVAEMPELTIQNWSELRIENTARPVPLRYDPRLGVWVGIDGNTTYYSATGRRANAG